MPATVIVLAAGRGSRFGGTTHKLAQPFGSANVLAATIANALGSGLPTVVVTTSALVPTVQAVVAAKDIVLLPPVGSASREPLGMGYSIAAGVTARSQASGWLVLPGDMPLIRPETLHAVARALEVHPVAYSQYRGRRGHPVGFAAELYSDLAQLTGDEGARRLVARYPAHAVEVDDPGILFDVDTPSDLAAARLARVDTGAEPMFDPSQQRADVPAD
ncbi:MAG: nucleotidyltransferase family protein [Burkholderiales bacterium]|nr:nucleotidyltransferase family protein [Burkholderiales bacterium]